MAGRPRKHADDAERLHFKASRAKANTLRIYIEYLNALDKPCDMQALLDSATTEYIAAHATLVVQAVEWARKGRKPLKEVAR